MKKNVLLLLILSLAGACNKSKVKEKTEDFPEPRIQQEMVLIPGGSFLMGKETDPESNFVDNPIHKVFLDSFRMDKYEVTNAEYFAFCQETGQALPEFWGMDAFYSGMKYPDHAVVGITWAAA